MFANKKVRTPLIILFILILGVYIVGLFTHVSHDGAKYAYLARTITEQGHWFNLEIQGEHYQQKPQFLFWIAAISMKIFGVSVFAFKLPILLFSFAGFAAVYFLGKDLFNKNTGFLATFILVFSTISVIYNSDIHIDVLLQSAVAISLCLLYRFIKTAKTKYGIFAGIFLGFSILIKGPFGVVIPVFAVLGYYLSLQNFKGLFNLKWLAIALIAFIVSLPAFIAPYFYEGWKGVWFFIWQNNMGRVTGSYMGTSNDYFFYVYNVIIWFIPWSLFLIKGIGTQFKKLFSRQLNASEQFIFWGTWIIFIILSIAKSKLPNYIQVLMPFFSIIAAQAISSLNTNKKGDRNWLKAQTVITIGIWILTLAVPVLLDFTHKTLYWIIEFILIILSILLTLKTNIDNKKILRTSFALVGMGLAINLFFFPKLLELNAPVNAAKIINKEIAPTEKIYCFETKIIDKKKARKSMANANTIREKHFFLNYDLLFYSKEDIINIETYEAFDSILTEKGIWIYTDAKGLNKMKEKISENLNETELISVVPHRISRYIYPEKREKVTKKRYLIHLMKE